MIEAAFVVERPGFRLDVAFTAGAGATVLFGPSGSGKTTILNVVAGLEKPASGSIRVDGEVFADMARKFHLPAHRRRVGYVFQDAALFPHLSVASNLRYGERKGERSGFGEVVELLGLEGLLKRAPAGLSGGERQRVAIGRALLSAPRLLLMDEPLSSLDIGRRQEILPYIEALRDRLRLPILYVTHAVDEAARLGGTVLIVEAGRIVEEGPPEIVLAHHLEEGRFARLSILTGRASSYDERYGLSTVDHAAGRIAIAGKLAEARDIRIVVRATDVALALTPPKDLSMRTALEGRIAAIEADARAVAIVDVELAGGQHLAAALTRKAIDELGLVAGRPVFCLIKAVSIDERWLRSA